MVNVRPYTDTELMVLAAARLLRPGETVFAGIGTGGRSFVLAVGIPVVACEFARRYLSIDLELQIGPAWDVDVGNAGDLIRQAAFCDWPASAQFTASWGLDGFARGDIDVAFLTGAQIDRFGAVNTVVLTGRDGHPVRLVGCVALTDHMACSKRVILVAEHSLRTFVPKVGFVAGVGRGGRGGELRRTGALPGKGPDKVLTNLALLGFDDKTGELIVEQLHPGVARTAVEGATGFDLHWLDPTPQTPPPTREEIAFIRREIDPRGVWLGAL